jgi:uncharacterized protein YbaR (Trm112 family)
MPGAGEQQTQGPVPETAGAATATHTDRRVLMMLICPCTRTELVYDAARQELLSRAARLAFPIRDGVPVMTPDEARPLDDDELRALAKRCGPAKPAT